MRTSDSEAAGNFGKSCGRERNNGFHENPLEFAGIDVTSAYTNRNRRR
jgi:hypothetical protein